MVKNPIILSTKKLLPNQKQILHDNNFNLIEEDFISIINKKNDFVGEDLGEAIIFTSQNSVSVVLESQNLDSLKQKNVFCVGLKTKEIVKKNGFKVIECEENALNLAKKIIEKYNKLSFTFFSGNLRRDVLPNTLKENGIKSNEIEVYETLLTPKKVIEKLDGILFFSPSAVESYLKSNTIKDEMCFCIGETTAETLENKKIMDIIIAETPTVENVIDEVIEYYKN